MGLMLFCCPAASMHQQPHRAMPARCQILTSQVTVKQSEEFKEEALKAGLLCGNAKIKTQHRHVATLNQDCTQGPREAICKRLEEFSARPAWS